MSKYTAELRTIVDLGYDIFDWSLQDIQTDPVTQGHVFNRTAASKLIVSDDVLIQGFIDHFYFREIGAETLERFKHFLKVQWNESLGEFDALLVAYQSQADDIFSNNSSEFVTIANDTPKNALDFGKEKGHASFINNGSSKGLTITRIEALELFHQKIKDIQTEFYDSFDNLFMQLY